MSITLIFYFILLAFFFSQVTALDCALPPVDCGVTQQVFTWQFTNNEVYDPPGTSAMVLKLAYTEIIYEGLQELSVYRTRFFGLAWCLNITTSHTFSTPIDHQVTPNTGLFYATANNITGSETTARLIKYIFFYSTIQPPYNFVITYAVRTGVGDPFVPIPIDYIPTNMSSFNPTYYSTPDYKLTLNNNDFIAGYPTTPTHSTHTCSASSSASVSRTPTSSITRTPSTSVSATRSRTPSISTSGEPSNTPSTSLSASRSTSVSASKSRTPSTTSSRAPSSTPTTSRTPSNSKSITPSVTPTNSRTPSSSTSKTRSKTPSRTSTTSISSSRVPTISPSTSLSASVTSSKSVSITRSTSVSRTASISRSRTPSVSPSISVTPSKSVTASSSGAPSPSTLPSPIKGIPTQPVFNWNARVRLGKFGFAVMIGASELGLIPWDKWKSAGAPSKSFWTNGATVPIGIKLNVSQHDATFFYPQNSVNKSLVYNDNYLPAGFRRLGQTNNVATIWCSSFGDATVALTDIRLNGNPLCKDIVTTGGWELPYYVTLHDDNFAASTNGWELTASLSFSWDGSVNLDDLARCNFLFGRSF